MSVEDVVATQTPSEALVEAAGVAGYAPSIHNTQPWRWRVDGDSMKLYAEPVRQLTASDPAGRLMVLSCGAALHHARTALAARGWLVKVDRLPDPNCPPLLAELTAGGRTAITPAATRRLQTIHHRHTDRRPVDDAPVHGKHLDAIRAAVEAEGTWLHTVGPTEVLDLAVAADRAQTIEELDPNWHQEIADWAGGARTDGLGVPDTVIPSEPPKTTVPGRTFGITGTLPMGDGHDQSAVYVILFGADDTPKAWLRAGEALSAAWLTANELGVSVLPMSAAVEVEGTRPVLRRILSELGEPFLVLRLGVADVHDTGPPPTPRLPSDQVIEVVGGRTSPSPDRSYLGRAHGPPRWGPVALPGGREN